MSTRAHARRSFGMGVKEIESERFDYRNVVQPDMDAASAKWESVTRSCFKDNVSPPPSEFATTFQLSSTSSIPISSIAITVSLANSLAYALT